MAHEKELAAIPLFSRLEDDDLERLGKTVVPRSYASGATIVGRVVDDQRFHSQTNGHGHAFRFSEQCYMRAISRRQPRQPHVPHSLPMPLTRASRRPSTQAANIHKIAANFNHRCSPISARVFRVSQGRIGASGHRGEPRMIVTDKLR